MSDYKIQLGVQLDTSDIVSQINAAEKQVDPIKIKIDAETKELTNSIRDALKSLTSGTKNALTLDTTKIESSLNDVGSTIKEIKKSIGTLDSGAGMKSLLSSINQISTALEKASNQFVELNRRLSTLGNSAGQSLNIDDVIDKQVTELMEKYAIAGKKGSKAFEEIRQAIVNYRKELAAADNLSPDGVLGTFSSASGSRQVVSALANHIKFANEAKESYKDLYDFIKLVNTSGAKVHMPDTVKQEFGDDYARISKGLGSAFTSGVGQDLEDFLMELNSLQGGIIDMSQGIEHAVLDLYNKLSIAKGKKFISGDDLFDLGYLKFDDVENDIISTANAIDAAIDKVGSGADTSGLATQLNSIVADLGEIKSAVQSLSSSVSVDGLTASFDKLSNSIELLINNATNMKIALNDSVGNIGGSAGQASGGISNIENDLKEITVTANNTSDAIQSMRNAMSGMKLDSSSIDAVTSDLKEMNVVIKEISAKKGNNFDITIKGINEVGEAITVIKRFNAETGNFDVISTKISKPFDEGVEAARRFKKEAETVKNIKFDIKVGNFENQMDEMYAKFNRLSDANKELRSSVEAVENAYEELKNAAKADTGDEVADRERLIQAEKRYAEALEKTNNLIKMQARADKIDADNLRLEDNREKFQAKIDTWMTKNSAATKRFGADLLDLRAKAEKADQVDLNHLEAELYKIDKAADKAGLKMQSFGDRVGSKLKEYMAYLSVAEVFMYAEQALSSMFEQVKLIDSAMTELKKVTDETDASYDKFLTNAASRAKEIGTTIDGLIESTTDFARLGYDFADAQGLAEVANIYAVVGDEIEGVEGATESLISTMAAFKGEMNGMSNTDFAMSIIDRFNEIGNNFSISSGGIGEALERSASSLMAANNTIDESIALITAANSVVQSPEQVGNAFKTISMRIRGAKTELEEMGEDTSDMADSTAKLRQEILALSGVDIMENATEFKSTYKIMDELAAKWENLTDIQQANSLPEYIEIYA